MVRSLAKMAKQEDTDSPPLIGKPKLQLFTEQILMRKTRIKQKRSSTTKGIKKEPHQIEQEGQSCGIVKTYTPGWATHKQEDKYNCKRFLQGAMRLSPTLGSSTQEVQHQKDQSPECLALKASGGLLSGDPEGFRKQRLHS